MKLLVNPVFFFLATVILLSSCGKENSNSNSNTHFVKFKLKGNWVTWNNVFARVVTNSGSPSQSGFELYLKVKQEARRLTWVSL